MGEVSGTFTYSCSFNAWQNSWSVAVELDDDSLTALSDLIPWYGSIALAASSDENGEMVLGDTFSITADVSKALISEAEDYTIVTQANPDSPTGYTTTITVKDRDYENVYAYGDWEAVWADQEPAEDGISYAVTYSPDEWENGMNYASSSVLELTQSEGGDWSITLNLASSVMGVICYHDVNQEDLHDLFPQKVSFYVPYDAEKQSESFDWSRAFPNEDEDAVGTVDYDVICTTADGSELQLSVYTPAGYDPDDTETKYPVLYLIPGGGSTYQSWFTDGMINNIFDNLIESGEVVPTILVSMQREDITDLDADYLATEIINYIDKNYNTYGDAEHRALAGVSMGSVASTNIWMAHPELFSYYIFLSGANKEVFQLNDYEEYDEDYLALLQAAHYFTGGGTIDFNMYTGDENSASAVDLNNWLDHYGIAYATDVVVGVHNWPIWTQLMISYVPEYLWADTDEFTRGEAAAIFFRLLTEETRNSYWGDVSPYRDVAESDWYNQAIATLTNAGILYGRGNGVFDPTASITRAEFAAIVSRFFDGIYDGPDLFTDIAGHWAEDAINQTAELGILNGYTDGTFRPDNNITRSEAIAIINRLLDRYSSEDHLQDDMITWPDNMDTTA